MILHVSFAAHILEVASFACYYYLLKLVVDAMHGDSDAMLLLAHGEDSLTGRPDSSDLFCFEIILKKSPTQDSGLFLFVLLKG